MRKIILLTMLLLLNTVVCSAEIKKAYYPSDNYDLNRAVVSMMTKNDASEISRNASLGIRFEKIYWFSKPFWSKKYSRYIPVYNFMVLVGDKVVHKILKPVQYMKNDDKLLLKLSGKTEERKTGQVKIAGFSWTYKTKNNDVYNPVASKDKFIKDLMDAKTMTVYFRVDEGKEVEYKLSDEELRDIREIVSYDLYKDFSLVSQCPLAYHSPLNVFGF